MQDHINLLIKWLGCQKLSATSNKFNTALTYAGNRQDILMTYLAIFNRLFRV